MILFVYFNSGFFDLLNVIVYWFSICKMLRLDKFKDFEFVLVILIKFGMLRFFEVLFIVIGMMFLNMLIFWFFFNVLLNLVILFLFNIESGIRFWIMYEKCNVDRVEILLNFWFVNWWIVFIVDVYIFKD